jgi:hypothetical protein
MSIKSGGVTHFENAALAVGAVVSAWCFPGGHLAAFIFIALFVNFEAFHVIWWLNVVRHVARVCPSRSLMTKDGHGRKPIKR